MGRARLGLLFGLLAAVVALLAGQQLLRLVTGPSRETPTLAADAFVAAEASTGLSFTETQVQSQLAQHGADFGFQGVNNAAGRLDYISRLVDHVDAPGTTMIDGTYRGAPAVHYLDPETGLNVFTTPEGGFWGAWQLGPEQIENAVLRGRLQ